MRIVSSLGALGFAGVLLCTVPASAQQDEAGGALTFRDEQGQLVKQHRYPVGCYNVPEPGWVLADLHGSAMLVSRRNCLGEQLGEISGPTTVTNGQSVLVAERPEARLGA